MTGRQRRCGRGPGPVLARLGRLRAAVARAVPALGVSGPSGGVSATAAERGRGLPRLRAVHSRAHPLPCEHGLAGREEPAGGVGGEVVRAGGRAASWRCTCAGAPGTDSRATRRGSDCPRSASAAAGGTAPFSLKVNTCKPRSFPEVQISAPLPPPDGLKANLGAVLGVCLLLALMRPG